jgi:hypothetical protein
MKIKIISELISAVTIGVLFGLGSNGLHHKWHSLGRDAYLAHYSQNFDKLYARPVSAMYLVLIFVIMALLVFAVYKCIAFVIAKLLSAFSDKEEAVQK